MTLSLGQTIGKIIIEVITMRKNLSKSRIYIRSRAMIIGTYDENGNANYECRMWGGIVGMDKIIIDLSSHKTTDNLMQRKAF